MKNQKTKPNESFIESILLHIPPYIKKDLLKTVFLNKVELLRKNSKNFKADLIELEVKFYGLGLLDSDKIAYNYLRAFNNAKSEVKTWAQKVPGGPAINKVEKYNKTDWRVRSDNYEIEINLTGLAPKTPRIEFDGPNLNVFANKNSDRPEIVIELPKYYVQSDSCADFFIDENILRISLARSRQHKGNEIIVTQISENL